MESSVAPNVRVRAKNGPYRIQLEQGQTILFCDCGRSKNQPLCDSSHVGTEFTPLPFTAPESKVYWLCGCKHSGTKPLCDGTHNKLQW